MMIRKLIILAVFVISAPMAFAEDNKSDTFRDLDLLMEIFNKVRAQYVEEVDESELIEGAIRGMISTLDPHSSYVAPSDYREMQIQTRGEYGGVGLEVIRSEFGLTVIAPMDDTPGSRAGIQSGDIITHADGDPLSEASQDEAVNHLRGPVDTDVTLTIFREGVERSFDVVLTREIIILSAVSSRIERETIGYLRLTTFNNERLSRDARREIRDMQESVDGGMTGLILDLRNNPGGLLNQAIEISDLFLNQGEIVSMRGRNDSDNARWDATRGDVIDGLPLVILTNAGSASASEIVIGALQDLKRATIVGTRSFGKGIVQSVIPLGPERALRLTTARYYTPAGRAIQAKGIDPDIEVRQLSADATNGREPRRESDLQGHIEAEGSDASSERNEADENTAEEEETVARPPSVSAEEGDEPVDFQLQYALDLLQGVVRVSENETSDQ